MIARTSHFSSARRLLVIRSALAYFGVAVAAAVALSASGASFSMSLFLVCPTLALMTGKLSVHICAFSLTENSWGHLPKSVTPSAVIFDGSLDHEYLDRCV